MSKRKRHRSAAKTDERKQQLLDQLCELAGRVGVEVREEKLVREVGYSVCSGTCMIDGQQVVLLDSNAPVSDRVEVMLEVLAEQNIDGIYIEPELRRLITGTLVIDESSGRASSV